MLFGAGKKRELVRRDQPIEGIEGEGISKRGEGEEEASLTEDWD